MEQIPTSREAMSYAVQSARSGDVEIARIWLDIARELRKGSQPAPIPVIRMPGKSRWMAGGPAAAEAIRKVEPEDMITRVEQVDFGPVTAVMPTADQTQITLGELCASCGYAISLAGDMIVHTRTGQNVCPVETLDGGHTFATPASRS